MAKPKTHPRPWQRDTETRAGYHPAGAYPTLADPDDARLDPGATFDSHAEAEAELAVDTYFDDLAADLGFGDDDDPPPTSSRRARRDRSRGRPGPGSSPRGSVRLTDMDIDPADVAAGPERGALGQPSAGWPADRLAAADSDGGDGSDDGEADDDAPAAPFLEAGWISEVLHVVKSGKEATVYCCAGGPRAEAEYVALKVYRAREHRSFRNDAVYQEGRYGRITREVRALQTGTRFGREVQAALWTGHEWATLKRLHAAGADVPRPIAQGEGALLMEFLGDPAAGPGAAAQPLHRIQLPPEAIRPLCYRLLDNIELWLKLDIVHGDLSPFNILWSNGRLVTIDFPQAVDPRFNRHARDLLTRDITNVCRYFTRHGVALDADRITGRLWSRFVNSAL